MVLIIFWSDLKTLTLLMLLELLVLTSLLIMMFTITQSMEVINLYYTLMFLAVAACEAALGLSLMVTMIRMSGSDYFKFMVMYCKKFEKLSTY
uniref:NADH dehydrogenase subunit 4L n=1 Tax=Arion flagellus TaxID=236857 RepID=UPI00241047A1|nr:NADH dehydrogenase subunit 4L [Arion flagellus]WES82235.1 NADH dehydrogenase subunit 4L [Arion flagellus]